MVVAATGGVGPTPPLAPASPSFAALLLLLASVGVSLHVHAAQAAPAGAAWSGADEGSSNSLG